MWDCSTINFQKISFSKTRFSFLCDIGNTKSYIKKEFLRVPKSSTIKIAFFYSELRYCEVHESSKLSGTKTRLADFQRQYYEISLNTKYHNSGSFDRRRKFLLVFFSNFIFYFAIFECVLSFLACASGYFFYNKHYTCTLLIYTKRKSAAQF